MLKWLCSSCGKPADYHSCTDGVHRYYCGHHWWKYVNSGYVVQDMGINDVPIVEDVGVVKEGSC